MTVYCNSFEKNDFIPINDDFMHQQLFKLHCQWFEYLCGTGGCVQNNLINTLVNLNELN